MGKNITYTGMVMRPGDFPAGYFVPGRMAMTCCANDMSFLGYACRYKDASKLRERQWVKVTANIKKEEFGPYDGPGVILDAVEVVPAPQPEEPVINFAGLLELYPDPAAMVDRLNALGIPGVSFEQESVEKCGIRGTHLKVTVCGEEEESLDVHSHTHEHHEHTDHTGHDHDHSHSHDHDHVHCHDDHDHCHSHEHDHSDHHHEHTHGHSHSHVHRNLEDIRQIVNKLDLPEAVRGDVLKVYSLIAEAESHAHGRPVTEVHFHEVGSMDAVADITAFCLLLSLIGPEKVVVSPIKLGFGDSSCPCACYSVDSQRCSRLCRKHPRGNVYTDRCSYPQMLCG